MSDRRIAAITLHQPFATLVALGWKTLETRTWEIPAQRIVICAGKKIDEHAHHALTPRARAVGIGLTAWWDIGRVTGVVLAVVTLGEARPLVEADEPEAWIWDGVPRFAHEVTERRVAHASVMHQVKGSQKVFGVDAAIADRMVEPTDAWAFGLAWQRPAR